MFEQIMVGLIILKCLEVVILRCFSKDFWEMVWLCCWGYLWYFCSSFSLKQE